MDEERKRRMKREGEVDEERKRKPPEGERRT